MRLVPLRLDPENDTVPRSSLTADVRAEGVVVRSDAHDRRVKVVCEAFEELNDADPTTIWQHLSEESLRAGHPDVAASLDGVSVVEDV